MSNERAKMQNRIFAEEAAVVEVQSLIHELMESKGWSRADLARAMKVSRGRITQLFSDECTNLTMRLIARAIFALKEELVVSVKSKLSQEATRVSQKDDRCLVPSGSWLTIEDYSAFEGTMIANDNIFNRLASLGGRDEAMAA